MATSTQPVSKIQLVRVDGGNVPTSEISEKLHWELHIGCNCVPSSSNVFPSVVSSLHNLKDIVSYIDKCTVKCYSSIMLAF